MPPKKSLTEKARDFHKDPSGLLSCTQRQMAACCQSGFPFNPTCLHYIAWLGSQHPSPNVLGTPRPRSSRRWNFEISVTGVVPRHGVINWEEFGEKFWWVVLHSQWSTKLPSKFRPKFRPIFRPILRPEFRRVIKICRHNFALGNVRRKMLKLSATSSRKLGQKLSHHVMPKVLVLKAQGRHVTW